MKNYDAILWPFAIISVIAVIGQILFQAVIIRLLKKELNEANEKLYKKPMYNDVYEALAAEPQTVMETLGNTSYLHTYAKENGKEITPDLAQAILHKINTNVKLVNDYNIKMGHKVS